MKKNDLRSGWFWQSYLISAAFTKTLFQGKLHKLRLPSLRDSVPFLLRYPGLTSGLSHATPTGLGRVVRATGFRPVDSRGRLSQHGSKSIRRWHAAVFLQPLQFFAHFDLSVPGILAQAVAFAGEDQQGVGNA
jgi:hypothetical protein